MKTPKTLKQLAAAVSKIAGEDKYITVEQEIMVYKRGYDAPKSKFAIYHEDLKFFEGRTMHEAFTLFKAAHRKANV